MTLFSDDARLKASVGAFILSCFFLTSSYSTTFAFDHPLNLAVFVCFLSACVLLFLGASCGNDGESHSSKAPTLPIASNFTSLNNLLSAGSASDRTNVFRIAKSRGWTKLAFFCILCLRVELYRQLTVHTECAPLGHTYAIPFLVALYDYFRIQRHRQFEKNLPSSGPGLRPGLCSIITFIKRVRYYLFQSPQRYLISVSLLTIGGLLSFSLHGGRASTVVCPVVSGVGPRVRAFRNVSLLLDALLLIAAGEIYRDWLRSPEWNRGPILRFWGYMLMAVAAVWIPLGILISCSPGHGGFTLFVDNRFVKSAAGQGLLAVLVLLSSVQLLPYYGILGLCMLGGFVVIYTFTTLTLLEGSQPFPLIHSFNALSVYLAITVGLILFAYARKATEDEAKVSPKPNIVIRLWFVLLVVFGMVLAVLQPDVANVHPIDLLIFKARVHHNEYLNQATASHSLEEAVLEYQRRYNQRPPPGFDKWYDYATSRSSVVIDDFDQIYTDLLPFRAFSPQTLRDMTHRLATNPFNNIGAVSIRGGSPKVQDGIKPTHAWMVRAAAEMISQFSEHLPSMDIAFNLDDQPRVAVPWSNITSLRNRARPEGLSEQVLNGWSMNRASNWRSIEPADQTSETTFIDHAWHPIFDEYASQLCPPTSEARTQRIWDRSEVSLNCIRPHSLGQFPSDWHLATDICHQPDLATLHGFLLSPTAFKTSKELVPVFSQSTVYGFNDILYPSPWNYVEKVKYDPSKQFPDPEYQDKNNTLFWIGSTSEGVSSAGGWKGMARQRFSHLINNNTESKVSVLLPAEQPGTYSYEVVDGSAPVKDLRLNASVRIAEPIAHCDDCETQDRELGTTSLVDFQSHWANRYLFDVDGAGFSGRFLPFLQSRSLPFKAGLFRQWFDTRLTAWLHFVPIDLRLHGVWSTLAYFAGVDGTVSRKDGILSWLQPRRKVNMEPHDLQGRWISEEGRKWAETVLRKEDMEVYFFRLLLEWGRLTDDYRDYLGFELKS